MSTSVLRRVVRRETHSPRTAATAIVLVCIALAAIFTGIEIVLSLLGRHPLLIAPGAALDRLRTLPEDGPRAAVIVGGAIIAVIGMLLIWLAVSPGRRPKHELALSASHAVVVDNAVIASAVADRVRRELDLSKGGAVVGVGHWSADVTVRPEPGQNVEKATVQDVVEAELARYDLSPRVRAHVRILPAQDEERVL
jgi:hypothetical protein